MRRVATSWKVIRARFKEHAHSTFLSLRPPATKAAIAELEAKLGVELPAAVKASYRVHDGMGYGQTLGNYHRLCPLQNVAGWWRIARADPWPDEFQPPKLGDNRRLRTDRRWRDGWVPLMDTAGGDLMCLDLDPGPRGKRGQMFRWYNNGLTRMRVLAGSFAELLDRLAAELEAYRFTFTDYGALQLTDGSLG